jgi:hypothetical protein
MLVLALQFSKGSDGAATHDDYLTQSHRWDMSLAESDRAGHSVGSGSKAPCRRRGRGPNWVGSLKTEEKTKFVEPACQEDESYN